MTALHIFKEWVPEILFVLNVLQTLYLIGVVYLTPHTFTISLKS